MSENSKVVYDFLQNKLHKGNVLLVKDWQKVQPEAAY